MTKTAAVIGAGIAGLVAARALSESFEKVYLIDRDYLGIEGARRGVAQSRHLHVLLRRGRLALEELFPGLDADLESQGAPEIDWSLDTAWLSRGGWFPRSKSEITTRSCSRDLLESAIRSRVLALPNIIPVEKAEVKELGLTGSQIQDVRCGSLRFKTDWVIDASGRTSRFFQDRDYHEVDASVGYASQLMEIPKDSLNGFRQLYIQMRPPHILRGGVLIPLEGGLHMVTLIGAGRDYPPSDVPGFLEFARSLHDPTFHEVIRNARPASPISTYRKTKGHRARAHTSLPKNFLSIGDSYCAFNPVYGQGMTVAALSGLALRDEISSPSFNRAGFESKVGRLTFSPWIVSMSEDLRVRTVQTRKIPWATRSLAKLVPMLTDAVIKKSVQDPSAHLRFLRVLHMLDSPSSLIGSLL